MPFADSKDFEDCVKKRMAEGKYTKEVATKVCGKMKSELEKGSDIEENEPSPTKKDTKEINPVVKAWEFKPDEIMSSPRKVTGTFHVPKIDKDNEIITKAAMGDAIPDFMHLPILHDFHKERVLGVVTKVWEEADAFHFNALFKATNDVDDAWAKVQKGEYDHVSIFGARLKGNTSCGLNPGQRSVPCISEKIRLDSISACDTNARNDSTSLGLAKAFYTDENNIIKALSSDSGLTHGIYDGAKGGRKSDMKVHEADGDDVEDDEKEEKKAFSRAGRAVREEGASGTRRAYREVYNDPDVTPPGEYKHGTKEAGFGKAEGSPAVREDIEAKKKDFKERQSGEKRSEGEDFHGGRLEKSIGTETTDLKHTKPLKREHSQPGGYEDDDGTTKRTRERSDVMKSDCSTCSLQKAKDGLKKIYSMLKHLTESDKKMVEKDKEVHDKMEKGVKSSNIGVVAGSTHETNKQSRDMDEGKDAVSSGGKRGDLNPRFSKGGTRPKVTEEKVEPKKIGTSQPTNKDVEEVKKGDNMTETEEKKEEVIEKANLEQEMTDEQFVLDVIQKANLKSTEKYDEIVKAAVAAQVDEIRKGFETQIAELKAQLTKIEEQPMVKAAIIVPEGGKVDMPLNYAAIAQMTKRG